MNPWHFVIPADLKTPAESRYKIVWDILYIWPKKLWKLQISSSWYFDLISLERFWCVVWRMEIGNPRSRRLTSLTLCLRGRSPSHMQLQPNPTSLKSKMSGLKALETADQPLHWLLVQWGVVTTKPQYIFWDESQSGFSTQPNQFKVTNVKRIAFSFNNTSWLLSTKNFQQIWPTEKKVPTKWLRGLLNLWPGHSSEGTSVELTKSASWAILQTSTSTGSLSCEQHWRWVWLWQWVFF